MLSWGGTCSASSYAVTISGDDTTTNQQTNTRHLKLGKLHGGYTVTVHAFTTGGGMTSASARL